MFCVSDWGDFKVNDLVEFSEIRIGRKVWRFAKVKSVRENALFVNTGIVMKHLYKGECDVHKSADFEDFCRSVNDRLEALESRATAMSRR